MDLAGMRKIDYHFRKIFWEDHMTMAQNEMQWDKLLKIKTTGRDDSNSDQYRYPYEPTPYCVLERLAGSDYIGKNNKLLDYGTGKGRVRSRMTITRTGRL